MFEAALEGQVVRICGKDLGKLRLESITLNWILSGARGPVETFSSFSSYKRNV